MMYKPIPTVILFLFLAFIRLSHTTNVFSTTTDIAQIFTSPAHLFLPTSPAHQAVHHVGKLCKKEQKSIQTLRLLEPCWKGEICYLNTQNNKCIKARVVDKLKDQLDHVGDLVITQTAIYKIPLTESLPSDYGFLYHAFVVFNTPESPAAPWWSIEKTIRSLIIQRSSNKDEVLDFRDGEKRWDSLRGLPRVVVEDKSRMLLSELLQFLHDSGEINHDYHGINANCQDFAKMIFNKLANGISAW